MAAKLIRTLQDFCPGRFEVSMGGCSNSETYWLEVIEYYDYTNEGSGEETGMRVIYRGQGESDLAKLEEEALKVIRRLEP